MNCDNLTPLYPSIVIFLSIAIDMIMPDLISVLIESIFHVIFQLSNLLAIFLSVIFFGYSLMLQKEVFNLTVGGWNLETRACLWNKKLSYRSRLKKSYFHSRAYPKIMWFYFYRMRSLRINQYRVVR